MHSALRVLHSSAFIAIGLVGVVYVLVREIEACIKVISMHPWTSKYHCRILRFS
jgi:hypothetical protein